MKVMKGINRQIMAEFVVMVLATKYVGKFGPAGPINKVIYQYYDKGANWKLRHQMKGLTSNMNGMCI